jgi:hypothetical protein
VTRRPKRNDTCPCGSGRKYKRCHGHPSAACAHGHRRTRADIDVVGVEVCRERVASSILPSERWANTEGAA